MKSVLITLAAVVVLAAGLSQCTAHRASVYEAKMEDLRTQVKVGDNIYAAAKKIEGRYHYTSGPLDPMKLGKQLWLHVDFGLQPTTIESVAYSANASPPFMSNKPISAVIKAGADGTITSIE